MVELELEKTFLLRRLPEGLAECRFEVIRDAFLPVDSVHPVVRLRQRGERFEITKKEPINGGDSSRQEEHTIRLPRQEFNALNAIDAKRFAKRRYYSDIAGRTAEVDVYFEDLTGLAVVDFEFSADKDMVSFGMPGICLADVTQEKVLAGGMLAGKTYADIEPILRSYGHERLELTV